MAKNAARYVRMTHTNPTFPMNLRSMRSASGEELSATTQLYSKLDLYGIFTNFYGVCFTVVLGKCCVGFLGNEVPVLFQ